jgi:hypothetical protein
MLVRAAKREGEGGALEAHERDKSGGREEPPRWDAHPYRRGRGREERWRHVRERSGGKEA